MAAVLTNNIFANLKLFKKGKKRKYLFAAAAVTAFVFFCLLSVWPQQKKLLMLKQLSEKQKILLGLQQKNTELKVQLEHLVSYAVVEEYAKNNLNMRSAQPGQVVYVRKKR